MNLYIHASTFSRHPHEQYIYRDWKLCYTVIPTENLYVYVCVLGRPRGGGGVGFGILDFCSFWLWSLE